MEIKKKLMHFEYAQKNARRHTQANALYAYTTVDHDQQHSQKMNNTNHYIDLIRNALNLLFHSIHPIIKKKYLIFMKQKCHWKNATANREEKNPIENHKLLMMS